MSAMTMLNDLGNPIQQVSLDEEADVVASANLINGPLFILAPPRSFTSVVCAMLGQHPQMYGLPELHLFAAETVRDRTRLAEQKDFNIHHGLLRVIAQLYFGEQSEVTVRAAC